MRLGYLNLEGLAPAIRVKNMTTSLPSDDSIRPNHLLDPKCRVQLILQLIAAQKGMDSWMPITIPVSYIPTPPRVKHQYGNFYAGLQA